MIKKFKIGLLVSSYSIDKHYYNLIKNLDKQEDVEDDNITGIHHVDNNEDYIVVDTYKKSIWNNF